MFVEYELRSSALQITMTILNSIHRPVCITHNYPAPGVLFNIQFSETEFYPRLQAGPDKMDRCSKFDTGCFLEDQSI
jgi:hypothetical protein